MPFSCCLFSRWWKCIKTFPEKERRNIFSFFCFLLQTHPLFISYRMTIDVKYLPVADSSVYLIASTEKTCQPFQKFKTKKMRRKYSSDSWETSLNKSWNCPQSEKKMIWLLFTWKNQFQWKQRFIGLGFDFK